jgi:GTP pyrophosphokinase
MASVDDLYAAIGYGGISLIRLMPHIKDEYNKNYKKHDETVAVKPTQRRTVAGGVTVEGIDDMLIKFAKCCNPLPGDNIIGFITRGHGVSIHKRDCPNVPREIAQAPEPERWINASWNENAKQEFRAALSISALSRIGLMADISMQLAAMRVNINDIASHTAKDGRSMLNMTITVSNVEHLRSVISRIEKIDGVLSIERQVS